MSFHDGRTETEDCIHLVYLWPVSCERRTDGRLKRVAVSQVASLEQRPKLSIQLHRRPDHL